MMIRLPSPRSAPLYSELFIALHLQIKFTMSSFLKMDFDYTNHTILIIDDEPANIQVVSDFLVAQGIETMIAKNGLMVSREQKRGSPI